MVFEIFVSLMLVVIAGCISLLSTQGKKQLNEIIVLLTRIAEK